MKTRLSSLLLVLCSILSLHSNAQQNSTPNAKQVIEQAIAAMGGKEYLASIKTLYTDISTEMEGRKVHWITKEMRPNKGAFQIVYNDRIVFQNWYDGEAGYEVVNGEKQKADPREFSDKTYKKNIFNELDYLDSSLWKLELIGVAKVEDEDCYKIKATLANGAVRLLYYSTQTFYQLREDKLENKEKDSFSTVLMSGYQRFGKLSFYTVMKFVDSGQTGRVVNVLANEGVTGKDFK